MDDYVKKAAEYAVKCHEDVNHRYGDMPYAVHLGDTYNWGRRFAHLIPATAIAEFVLAACWCHDLIEDARQSYNDVREIMNTEVADIVYAVTNEKGKTRKERANAKYYEGIRAVEGAVFVKVCDRLANASMANGSMRSMYRKEQEYFKQELWTEQLAPMFDELDRLLS